MLLQIPQVIAADQAAQFRARIEYEFLLLFVSQYLAGPFEGFEELRRR